MVNGLRQEPTDEQVLARLRAQITALEGRIEALEEERSELETIIRTVRDAVVPPFLAYLSPVGIGDDEYPTAGYARINSEVMKFDRAAGSDILTVAVNMRGLFGTEVAEHDRGDTVQLCLQYENQRIDNIMRDLLTEYGNVPGALIDGAGWETEASCWLLGHVISGIVTEPTGVTSLLGELSRIGPYIWWDERAQIIRLRAQRPELAEDVRHEFDDSNAIMPGGAIKDLSDDRLTQIYLFFDPVSQTRSLNDAKNFHRLVAQVSPDAERPIEYGDRKAARFFTRWIDISDEHLAKYVTGQLALRTRYTPVELELSLDPARRAAWTGDVVRLATRMDQDASGAPTSSLWTILSAEEDTSGDRVRYRLRRSDYSRLHGSAGGRFGFVAPDATADYASTAAEQRGGKVSWIAEDAGRMPDGTPAWIII